MRSSSFAVYAVLLIAVLLPLTDGAKFCYSGRGKGALQRQCGQGGDAGKYVCQTFVCEGGKSPFQLRTCAQPNMGCMAGPAICKYSGGSGSCQRCENDNCNL